MRHVLILALLATHAASAHTLDGDASLVEELQHQLGAAHHLPTLLLLAAGIGLIAWRRGRRQRS